MIYDRHYTVRKHEDGIAFYNLENDLVLEIETFHPQDCCENVYAEWNNFDTESDYLPYGSVPTIEETKKYLELVRGNGFRLFYQFIPCYNEQNGYYSDELYLTIKDRRTGKEEEINITSCNYDMIG